MNLAGYRAFCRTVECPGCGAEPGAPCMHLRDGDFVEYVHDDRSWLASESALAAARQETAQQIAEKIEAAMPEVRDSYRQGLEVGAALARETAPQDQSEPGNSRR